jgi:hypothetical protein
MQSAEKKYAKKKTKKESAISFESENNHKKIIQINFFRIWNVVEVNHFI